MLGWEFPPHISGGLGTACKGLTGAMGRLQARILFVLPRAIETEPRDDSAEGGDGPPERSGRPTTAAGQAQGLVEAPVKSEVVDPYGSSVRERKNPESKGLEPASKTSEAARRVGKTRRRTPSSVRVMGAGTQDGYDGDLAQKVHDYAGRCANIARRELFDVIHAHDWMTFPAAMAIADLSGRPLVVHVHATEYDRAGESINPTIYGYEWSGMHAAARVIAVSEKTRRVIVQRYGVPPEKVSVVYNGIEINGHAPSPVRAESERIVLFLGRITMQKGPEYFIRAAAKVARRVGTARFIVAGAGDQLPYVRRLAADLGIEDRVDFTGFLHGDDVDGIYRRADVYAMPSVSEPFGLTALEAARNGVPVILSKGSGVAEVLVRGSLKVDFWDVDLMAKMIVAVLEHPSLAEALRRESAREIRGLTWDEAARKCMKFYHDVVARETWTGSRAAIAV
jgi:glycogen(starch) synthase